MCMRTTIEISDELLRQAKRRAVDEGIPLREVVERALQSHLMTRAQTRAFRLRWRTESGRILPGVRLDDRDALYETMDGRP